MGITGLEARGVGLWIRGCGGVGITGLEAGGVGLWIRGCGEAGGGGLWIRGCGEAGGVGLWIRGWCLFEVAAGSIINRKLTHNKGQIPAPPFNTAGDVGQYKTVLYYFSYVETA